MLTFLLVIIGWNGYAQTPTPGDYQSVTSGNWSDLTTWQRYTSSGWATPSAEEGYPGQNTGTNDVRIQDGHTITIDVSPSQPVANLIVGEGTSGVLQYEATTARTLTVTDIVRINSGGTFRSAQTGTVTTHHLIVDAGIVNEGTLDFSTNTAGAGITFTGSSSGIFDLSNATLTDLMSNNGLVLNKGTGFLSFTPGGTFQVQSANALGFLTIQSGTFRLMGQNTFSNPLFYASTGSYTIPSGGGFQLDNPNATIVGLYGTLTNNGEIIIRDGVYNIGTGTGNESLTTSTGRFEMSGGEMNISGRFRIDDGTCLITGGVLNLATIGHANRTLAAFHISESASLTISGDPLITFAFPNSNANPFNDIEIEAGSGSKTITGGTFQLGTAATPATRPFYINSDIPIHNLVVYSANTRVVLTDHLTVNNQLTLNGRLSMINYNLNLGAPAITGNFSNSAGMIVTGTGEIHKTISDVGSYLFPLGDVSASPPYLPVTLDFTSGTFTPGASVSVRMFDSKHPQNVNTTNFMKRYWTVRTSGIMNPVYNFTGKYDMTGDITGNDGYMRTGIYTTVWQKTNTLINSTITATGLTGNVDITGIDAAAPTVTISPASPSICSGASVQLTANATGDAPLTYSWDPTEGLSNPAIANPIASPTATTTYTVTVTNGMGESATANVLITVNPVLPVSVSVASNDADNTVCAGTNVTFTATATNGGLNPVYQWKVNGNNVGSNSATYSYSPSNNDNVTCELVSNAPCATGSPAVSAPVHMTVNPLLPVNVSIVASANPACAGSEVTFTATPVNGGNAPLYQWRVNGLNIGPATSSNTYTTSSLTNGQVVTVVLTSNAPCATGSPRTSNAIVMGITPIPSAPTAGSNTPVCTNGTINLTASTITGATYAWTGPDGFTSSVQNPSIPNATAAMAGQYSVIATVNGCSSPAGTTNVSVTAPPSTPTATSNTPACEGQTISLTTPTVAGATYAWTGPDGFTSSVQNPTRSGATLTMAGTYRVTITLAGCVSEAGETTVAINPRSATPVATNDGAACVGGTIHLSTAEIPGASYSWTGPNGFTSNIFNPTLANVTTGMAGTYQVIVTANGCPGLPGTTEVTVNPIPSAPIASSNTPCVDGTIQLNASSIVGATYSWTGPNGFSSSLQNPTRPNATAAMAGVYSVTVTVAGCTSAAGATNVTVNPIPATPTITNNNPVCTNGTISLTTTPVANAIYSWTGPNGFTSSQQNLTRTGATTAMAGPYSLTVTVDGCPSVAGTTNVVVNSVPATPTASSNSPVCAGSTINLFTPTVAGATYSWTGPNGFTSNLQNPSRTGATTAMTGTYSVTVTVGGCTSSAGSTTVTVNPTVTPSVTISSTSQAICSTPGTAVTFTATPTNGGTTPTYQWQRNGANIAGATGSTYTVTSLQNPSTISVVMTSNATCATPATATSNAITMTVYTGAPTTSNGNGANAKPSSPQSTSICPPATNLVYNIPSSMTANAALYTWDLPPGFNIIAGAGTSQITVSVPGPGSSVGAQDIRVMATNPCGSSSWSSGLTINVGTFAAVNVGSNFSMCLGNSATLTNILSGNATSVTWTVVSGNGTISGGPYPAPFQFTPTTTGSVTLRATTNTPTGSGCPNVPGTAQVTITVNQPSVAPTALNVSQSAICSGSPVTLTQTGGSLGSGASWRWYSNNTYTTLVGASTSSDASLTVNPTTTTTYYLRAESTTGAPCAANVAGPSAGVTVTVSQPSAAPTALNASPSPVCSGSPVTLTQTGGSLGTGASWRWYSDATYTTLVGTGTGANASLTVNPTVNTTYYLRAEGGTAPCTVTVEGPAAGVSVIVSQPSVAPTALNVSQSAICSGSPVTLTQTGGSLGSGATWRWYSNNTYTTLVGASTSSDASLTVNPTATTTYYLRAESTTGAPCAANVAGPSAGVTVTVSQPSAAPTALNASPSPVCSGSPVTLTQTGGSLGTGASWRWYSDATYTTLVGTGTGVNASLTVNPTVNTTYYLRAEGGTAPCTVTVEGPAAGVSVTVSQPSVAPTALNVSQSATCSGSPVTLTQTGGSLGTGATWRWYSNNSYTTLVGTSTSSDASLTVNPTATTTYYLRAESTTGAPCAANVAGPSAGVVVTVNQPVLITSQPNPSQSVCAGFPVSLSVSATGNGLTYAWYKDGSPLGITTPTLSFGNAAVSNSGTYTVVVSGATGCSPVTSNNAVISVSQDIDITTQPVAQTLCEGNTVQFTVAATGNITSYVWRKGGIPVFDGANMSGAETATLTITNLLPGDSGNYDVVISGPGGVCGQTISNPASLTVNANSTIALSSASGTDAQTSCISTPITNITYQLGGGATGATVTGLPTGITSIYNSTTKIFTISGTPASSGTFAYTVTTTGPCVNPSLSGSITVSSNSTITLSSAPTTASQTVCVDNAIESITYAVGGSATGASITAGTLPDGVTGSYNAGVFTISGIPTASGTFNYTVSTSGSCTNASLSGTITVNANSTIALSSAVGTDAQTRCVNNPITNITYQLGGGATGATVTGLPSGVSGSYNGGIFTISGTPNVANSYNYTVTTTGPCINNSISGTITVTPNATITLSSAAATTSQTVCVNTAIANITYSIGGGATGATVTGLPSGVSGSYNGGIFTISGTPTIAGSYNFTVSTTGSSCLNPSLSGTITVSNNGTISLTSGNSDQSICINTPITNITYAVGGSATGVTAINLPSGITGNYNAGVYVLSGIPTTSGDFNFTLSTTGTCASGSVTGIIHVSPVSVGGTLSPYNYTVCTTTNSGSLTLSGYNGIILRWESSTNAGTSWTTINNTTPTYNYTNLPLTTIFRAVVKSGACSEVYSVPARVVVVPLFEPIITATTVDVCNGNSTTLSVQTGLLQPVGAFTGGGFNQANPVGWRVSQNGTVVSPFPAAGDNRAVGPWAETNGPRIFNGVSYDTQDNTKFTIVNGAINSTLETPVFNLFGLSSAELTFLETHNLAPGTTARVELSTDGGNSYNIVLATYTGSTGGVIDNPVNIDMSPYLGMMNMRIRFNYISSAPGGWALDGISIPSQQTDVTYTWSPAETLSSSTDSTVIATPGTTTTYTLTMMVSGCPVIAKSIVIGVAHPPTIQTTNACVGGGPVTFTQTGGTLGGTWRVSGGGTINAATGEFTPATPGCFNVSYLTPAGTCGDTVSFVVFPAAPAPVVNAGCGPIVITPPAAVPGFTLQYSFDNGATWGGNTPPTAENCAGYQLRTRYIITQSCDPTLQGAGSTIAGCDISPAVTRVVDLSPPVITCPANVTANANSNDCYATLTLVAPVVTDNCSASGAITVTNNAPAQFPVGVTTVTWTAVDACGNQSTCNQTITITDNSEAPVFNSCPADQVQTALPGNCSLSNVVIPNPVATDNCTVARLTWTMRGATTLDSPTDGINYVSGQTFNVGITTVTYLAYDAAGNASQPCSFNVWIKDLVKPVFTVGCPANINQDVDAGMCTATVTVPVPDVADPCNEGYTLTNSFTNTNNASGTYPIGTTMVVWTITDVSGNITTCEQTITINDALPTINCPSNVAEQVAADGCSKSDVTLGVPTFVGNCVDPILSYTLSGATTGSGSGYVPSDQAFGVGITTVTYTVTDSHNNTTSCSFTVTIRRLSIPPAVITCPANPAPVNVVAGTCLAHVTVAPPVEVDPCATVTYTFVNSFNNTNNASGNYPVGNTTVTWTITDNSGNTTTCQQTVTVNDALPSIICPSSVAEVIAADGCSKSDVTVGVPTFVGNCAAPNFTYTLTGATVGSGSGIILSNQEFNVGVTTVTYTVTDANNNTNSCSFTVTIRRLSIPPAVINCPANPAPVNVEAGTCTAFVNVAPPVEVDPCATVTYTFVNSFNNTNNASGNYPVGNTTVTWTITDNSGNITTCEQIVTVIDNQNPVIVCPASPAGICANSSGTYIYNGTDWNATATDVCGSIASLTYTLTGATTGTGTSLNGVEFNSGTTIVTWTATDTEGNTATCFYNVTVRPLPITSAIYHN